MSCESSLITRVSDDSTKIDVEVSRCVCGRLGIIELPTCWACLYCGLIVDKEQE